MSKINGNMSLESSLLQIFNTILSSRLSTDSNLQISSHLKPLMESLSSLNPSIILEIFIKLEGCHPLLLEKWTVSIMPSTDPIKETSLSSYISSLPLPNYNFQNPSFSLSTLPRISWSKSVKQTSFSLNQSFQSFTLHLCTEIPSEIPLPDIMVQDLGPRPRLNSIELQEEENFELDFSPTPDDPIIYLTQLTLNTLHPVPNTHFTTKICSKEHDSIGFSPLSHTICSEAASHISHNSFFFSSSPSFEDLPTEDEEISKYKLKCGQLSKISEFPSSRAHPLTSLKSSLIRMKSLLESL